jgi:methionyl-tRNA formyltransferase
VTERARTVFLGSGEFAVAPGQAALDHPQLDIVGVVTAPARPAGRGRRARPTPVARWAVEHGLPTLTPTRLRAPESVAELAALSPELIVLADYGQIVPASLLALPRHGALNLHPSLLPRHRGAAPIPAAILAGDARTGVTLMLMDAGLDSGPIVAQRELALAGDETARVLEERLSDLAAELLSATLADWLAGRIEPRPQPTDGVTLSRPLRREDGWLDAARPAVELARQVRAYQPWPSSFAELGGERVIVWRAQAVQRLSEHALGIVTPDGALELLEVQPAGGRRMAAADYLRGRPRLLERSAHPAGQAPSNRRSG